MRIAIHDFSQQAALGMVDTVEVKGKRKAISIDAVDLLILDWFTRFYPKTIKKIIDGKEYAWIKRSKVLEDLPILRISEDSVSDRLKKLVHFGLLEYKLVKDKGTFCYFRHGERFGELISTEFSTKSAEGTGSTPHRVPGQTGTGVPGQPRNKDSGLKDISIKDMVGSGKQSGKPTYPFQCPDCGHNVFKNTSTNYDECPSCFKRFPH